GGLERRALLLRHAVDAEATARPEVVLAQELGDDEVAGLALQLQSARPLRSCFSRRSRSRGTGDSTRILVPDASGEGNSIERACRVRRSISGVSTCPGFFR